ncbi:MAG: hypothetical protein ACRYFK_02845 [Janthinobacterium lividum]
MKTLVSNSPSSATTGSSAPVSTSWLWWLFLLGVLAFASAGPTCAWH